MVDQKGDAPTTARLKDPSEYPCRCGSRPWLRVRPAASPAA